MFSPEVVFMNNQGVIINNQGVIILAI